MKAASSLMAKRFKNFPRYSPQPCGVHRYSQSSLDGVTSIVGEIFTPCHSSSEPLATDHNEAKYLCFSYWFRLYLHLVCVYSLYCPCLPVSVFRMPYGNEPPWPYALL
jgi:hypothetical protein